MPDKDSIYVGAFGDMFIDGQYQLIHGDTKENLYNLTQIILIFLKFSRDRIKLLFRELKKQVRRTIFVQDLCRDFHLSAGRYR